MSLLKIPRELQGENQVESEEGIASQLTPLQKGGGDQEKTTLLQILKRFPLFDQVCTQGWIQKNSFLLVTKSVANATRLQVQAAEV